MLDRTVRCGKSSIIIGVSRRNRFLNTWVFDNILNIVYMHVITESIITESAEDLKWQQTLNLY